MKNKYWIILFCAVFVLCLALAMLPMLGGPATRAEIRFDDTRYILDLNEDQEFTLESLNGGYNTITIRDGKIAVTAADCPDQYCVRQGFCNSGEQIVCLPHKLVISFVGESEIDGAVG